MNLPAYDEVRQYFGGFFTALVPRFVENDVVSSLRSFNQWILSINSSSSATTDFGNGA
jgi:hypothetical protein